MHIFFAAASKMIPRFMRTANGIPENILLLMHLQLVLELNCFAQCVSDL